MMHHKINVNTEIRQIPFSKCVVITQFSDISKDNIHIFEKHVGLKRCSRIK